MNGIDVKQLAKKLADAYSTDNYGGDWTPCVRMLRRRGFNAREIEAIIRSKWTRWAADLSAKRYGQNNSADLARFLDDMKKHGERDIKNEVDALVAGTTFRDEVRSAL